MKRPDSCKLLTHQLLACTLLTLNKLQVPAAFIINAAAHWRRHTLCRQILSFILSVSQLPGMVYHIRSLYIMVLCYNPEYHWISLKTIELCSFTFNMNLTHWSNLVHSIPSATSCTNFLRQNISIEVPAQSLWKLSSRKPHTPPPQTPHSIEFYLRKNRKMKTVKQLRILTWHIFFLLPQRGKDRFSGQSLCLWMQCLKHCIQLGYYML